MKPVVFLACTGLGRVNRGYESFARECYDALKDSDEFQLYLLKGGGQRRAHEIVLPNFHRNSKMASWLGKLLKEESYLIEQFTFCISLLPLIFRKRPAVIYYSDFILGTYLWHLRRILKFRYKLLFSNGAPNGPPFKTEDHVQQLLPIYVCEATAGGTSLDKQTLLPYAININLPNNIDKIGRISILRKQLHLPLHKKIIISVGVINSYHKRMDYVVNEFANLDQNNYFLLMLGQINVQSGNVLKLAEENLCKENYLIRQVTSDEVSDYMAASDYFILASLNEGLPRVLPEALSNGLLPIVHDYTVTRQTLKQYGIYKDLTRPGALAEAIEEADHKELKKKDIINYSWENYSWEILIDQYKKMICGLF
jgi:glycosyltransferase involved in cell wall biosynthesis